MVCNQPVKGSIPLRSIEMELAMINGSNRKMSSGDIVYIQSTEAWARPPQKIIFLKTVNGHGNDCCGFFKPCTWRYWIKHPIQLLVELFRKKKHLCLFTLEAITYKNCYSFETHFGSMVFDTPEEAINDAIRQLKWRIEDLEKMKNRPLSSIGRTSDSHSEKASSILASGILPLW